MRIDSSFLVVLALSLKSTDGASLKLISNRAPLQKQLSQALKMIEVQQSTVPAAHKSVIRGLNQEDSGCNPIDPCIQALFGDNGDDGDGGSPSSSENVVYCSNDGEDNAQDMGGVFCPPTDPGVQLKCPNGTDATCCDADGSCTGGDAERCCGDLEDDGDYVNNPLSFLDDIGPDSEICDISTGICDFADSPKLGNATAACDASSERKLVLNDVLICKEDNDPEAESVPDMDITIRNAPLCVPRVCPDNVKLPELLLALLQQCPETAEELKEIPILKEQCDSGISIETDNGSGNSSVAARSMIWSISLTATISIGVYFTI